MTFKVGINPIGIHSSRSGGASGASAMPPLAPTLRGAYPSISGNPYLGQTLTANNGSWNANGAPITYTYQWRRNGSNISGATSKTYAVDMADVGNNISVAVTATNISGANVAISSSVKILALSTPVNTSLPAIVGTPMVGEQSAASGGTWSNGGSAITGYTYQWRKDGFDISGAEELEYEPIEADEGGFLQIKVTATNNSGSRDALSIVSPEVAGAAAAPKSLERPYYPVVAGAPVVGGSVGVTLGKWNNSVIPITFSYQWMIGDDLNGYANIPGETLSTLVITNPMVGKRLKAQVTGSNFLGSTSYTTDPSAPAVPAATGVPIVVNPPVVVYNPDGSFEVVPGEYEEDDDEPTYQWVDTEGNPLPGETGDTVSGTPEGVGGVIITIPGTGGDTEIYVPVVPVPPSPKPFLMVPPELSGLRRVGQTLTFVPPVWNPQGLTMTSGVEWRYSNGQQVPDTDEETTYVVQAADAFKVILVYCWATNVNGTTEAVTIPIGPIYPIPLTPYVVNAPTISGSPKVGQTLSVGTGEWDDGDTDETTTFTYSYQWKASGGDLDGATGNTLILTEDHIGFVISVEVSATNTTGTGTYTTGETPFVTPVIPVPTNTVAPVISGTPAIGETLESTEGEWNDNGSTIFSHRYQWFRGSTLISGETQDTYVVTNSDVGKLIRSGVIAANDGGEAGAYSNKLGPVPDVAPENDTLPLITGFTVAGQTLSATTGTWEEIGSPITGFLYQWHADGDPISGAVGADYLLTEAEIGKEITIVVTALHPTGGIAIESDPTYAIDASFLPPINLELPEISGDPVAGNELEVSNGVWRTNGYPIEEYAYQWRRDGSAISGATADTYELIEDDIDAVISCAVTATNDAGSITVESDDVGPIISAFDPDALAYIEAMSSEPDQTRKDLINTFVKNAKEHGWWQKADLIHLLAAHHPQAARLNLVDRTEGARMWVSAGSADDPLTYTTDRGVKTVMNGSLSDRCVLAFGKTPAQMTQYTLNSATMAVWLRTRGTNTSAPSDLGFRDDTFRSYAAIGNPNNFETGINGSGSNTSLGSPNTGLFGVIRVAASGAGSTKNKRNKATHSTGSGSSSGLPTGEACVGGGGHNSLGQNGQYAFSFFGAALSDTEWDHMYDDVAAYLSAVGAI